MRHSTQNACKRCQRHLNRKHPISLDKFIWPRAAGDQIVKALKKSFEWNSRKATHLNCVSPSDNIFPGRKVNERKNHKFFRIFLFMLVGRSALTLSIRYSTSINFAFLWLHFHILVFAPTFSLLQTGWEQKKKT